MLQALRAFGLFRIFSLPRALRLLCPESLPWCLRRVAMNIPCRLFRESVRDQAAHMLLARSVAYSQCCLRRCVFRSNRSSRRRSNRVAARRRWFWPSHGDSLHAGNDQEHCDVSRKLHHARRPKAQTAPNNSVQSWRLRPNLDAFRLPSIYDLQGPPWAESATHGLGQLSEGCIEKR